MPWIPRDEDGTDEATQYDTPEVQVTTVKSHTRKKTGRKPLADSLPREEVIHDLNEEERKCTCCGKERPCIGSDSTEELEFISAKIVVLRHINLFTVLPETVSIDGLKELLPNRLTRNTINNRPGGEWD